MLAENPRVVTTRLPEDEAIDEAQETPDHLLDSREALAVQSKLDDWWYQARVAHADNRAEQDEDEKFRDHEQWSAEDRAEIESRGQKATQFNVILPVIEWVTGSEKKARVDGKVLPRKDSKEEAAVAEGKTSLLKYLSDVNREPYEVSDAFRDAATVGVGWLEAGVMSDPTEEPLYTRAESWRNVWWDPLCRHRDVGKYGRYLCRIRPMDLDYAAALWPDRAARLRAAAEHIDAFDPENVDAAGVTYGGGTSSPETFGLRARVRVLEVWHRLVVNGKIMRGGGALHGRMYRPGDKVHEWAQGSGYVSLHDAIREQVFVGLCLLDADAHIVCLLDYQPSPYDHDRFPLVPIWGYRKGKNGMPFGLVRGLKDIQEDLNKRYSKSLFLLSSNQVIYEEDAVVDRQEMLDEVDRPDGEIRLKSGGMDRFQIRRENQLAEQHLRLMDMGKAYVQEVSGVTSENLGRETNATSGIAIARRQEQGVTSTINLFDNKRFALQVLGEIKLALAEQHYTEPKTIRILGDKGAQYLELNQQGDNGEMNLLSAHQQDFVIDEQDYRATVHQAMADQLLQIAGNLASVMPQLAVAFVDLAIDLIPDLPNKETIVARVRQITGMEDPDGEKDPEAAAAKQEQDAKAQEFQERMAQADLAIKEGEAALKQAKAMREEALAQTGQFELMGKQIMEKLGAFEKALTIAGTLHAAPQIGQTADEILDDASRRPAEEEGGRP